MTPDPAVVAPSDNVASALALMDSLRVRHLPVVDAGTLVGIVSDRDLLARSGHGVLGGGGDGAHDAVGEVMRRDPITAAPDDPIVAAATELSVHRIGCLPVVDAGKLVGIVTETDLLRLLALLGASGLAPAGLDPELRRLAQFGVEAAPAGTTLAQAAARMMALGVRHLPIAGLEGGWGALVSDRDLRRAIGAGVAADQRIADLSWTTPLVCAASARVSEAAGLMAEHKATAVVVADETLARLGIVTTTDLLEHALGALS